MHMPLWDLLLVTCYSRAIDDTASVSFVTLITGY